MIALIGEALGEGGTDRRLVGGRVTDVRRKRPDGSARAGLSSPSADARGEMTVGPRMYTDEDRSSAGRADPRASAPILLI